MLGLAAMKTSRFLPSALALLLLAPGPVAALHAQLPKIFVASFGNDANDGSRNAPKRNFQAAHDAVAAGGQIVALDTAGYGPLAINKGVAVTVPPGVNAFVTVPSGNDGITINAGAGLVALRGLIIENSGGAGGNGIAVTNVNTLVVESCTVRHFNEGISVKTFASTQVSLFDTTVRYCAYGIDLEDTNSAGTVVVALTGCRVEGCSIDGVLASTNGTGSAVDVTLEGCTVRGNGTGLLALSTGALLRASNCTIIGNGTGVQASNGAQALSRGNNTLEKNTGGNTFPATYSAK